MQEKERLGKSLEGGSSFIGAEDAVQENYTIASVVKWLACLPMNLRARIQISAPASAQSPDSYSSSLSGWVVRETWGGHTVGTWIFHSC